MSRVSDTMVEITDVTKRYGPVPALDGVSLSVKRGDLFGLIGPDGAGKSTLCRLLATLDRPDSGHARVCGLDTVTDYARLRPLIGYMPESFSLYQDLTVEENLRFFAELFGVSLRSNYQLIAPVFGQLERFSSRKAGALSGGMKQKLALSCALIHRPEILLLDEPTTGVDAVSRSEFWDMLSSLAADGITILVSTSYMDEASRCHRVAMMSGGRILAADTPAALVSGADSDIYNASAGNMFALLERLRAMPGVSDCYTFGATLHLVASPGFNPAEAESALHGCGLADAAISPTRRTLEDLFIKLTSQAHD